MSARAEKIQAKLEKHARKSSKSRAYNCGGACLLTFPTIAALVTIGASNTPNERPGIHMVFWFEVVVALWLVCAFFKAGKNMDFARSFRFTQQVQQLHPAHVKATIGSTAAVAVASSLTKDPAITYECALAAFVILTSFVEMWFKKEQGEPNEDKRSPGPLAQPDRGNGKEKVTGNMDDTNDEKKETSDSCETPSRHAAAPHGDVDLETGLTPKVKISRQSTVGL